MRDEAEWAEIRRKQRTEEGIRRSRLPRATQSSRRLEGFRKTEGNADALVAVADFLGGKISPPLLLLYGVKGVGKTRLAYHIAWTFIEDSDGGDRVLYVQVEDMLNELQSILTEGRSFARLWEALKTADLLILDDMGAHNPTDWRNSQLDALIDFRYREELPTIITSNKLDMPERILDRLKEGRTAMITGESWRGKKNV